MTPAVKVLRWITHINIGATAALAAWLLSSAPASGQSPQPPAPAYPASSGGAR